MVGANTELLIDVVLSVLTLDGVLETVTWWPKIVSSSKGLIPVSVLTLCKASLADLEC